MPRGKLALPPGLAHMLRFGIAFFRAGYPAPNLKWGERVNPLIVLKLCSADA